MCYNSNALPNIQQIIHNFKLSKLYNISLFRPCTDVEPGTVVVTNRAFNGFLKEEHNTVSAEDATLMWFNCGFMCTCCYCVILILRG